MDNVSKIYVRQKRETKAFNYRVYIKDLSGYLESGTFYMSTKTAIEGAVAAGKALGFPVFDGTDGGKEIWTPPKQEPKLVYPPRCGYQPSHSARGYRLR